MVQSPLSKFTKIPKRDHVIGISREGILNISDIQKLDLELCYQMTYKIGSIRMYKDDSYNVLAGLEILNAT